MNCPKCGQPFEPPHFCEGDGYGTIGWKIDLLALWSRWKRKEANKNGSINTDKETLEK